MVDNLPDGMHSNLVTSAMKLTNSRIVSVLVGNEERGLNITTVRILTVSEDMVVQVNIVVVDSVVKSDHDHLRNVLGAQVSRSLKIYHEILIIFYGSTYSIQVIL